MSLLDDVSIVVTPNGYKAGELYAVIPVPTEGADEIVDGNFPDGSTAWALNGWTISGNAANCSGITANMIQTISGSTNKQFLITFTISNYISGSVRPAFVGGYNYSSAYNANGVYTTVISSYSDIRFVFYSNSFNGSISNVSVKEYTSADMDVTRATAATRVDENGLVNYAEIIGSEEITNGDFATDLSGWVTNATIWSSGRAYVDAVPTGSGYIVQTILDSNKTYLIEATLEVVQGAAKLQLGSGDGSTVTYSSGTHQISVIKGGSELGSDGKIYFARENSTAQFYVDNVSVKEVDRDNVPRIDYTGGGCPHILAEPQRTNFVVTSASGTYGNPPASEILAIAPDGTNTAIRPVPDSASDRYQETIAGGTYSSGDEVTYSWYRKRFSTPVVDSYVGDLHINALVNCTQVGVATEIISEVNGFNRVSATFSITDGSIDSILRFYFGSIIGDGNSSVAYWGHQLEVGSYPTSLIPNFGTAAGVTRNQDIFTRDGIGSLINSTEGVLFVEMAALANDGTYREISLNDGTTNNVVEIRYTPTDNQFQFIIRNGGAAVVVESITLSNALDFNKIAFSYKSNDYKMYVNGVQVATDTSGAMPSGLNTLELDWGANYFYGKVKQLQVYDTALTDEQLLQLTGESGTDFYESYAEMASALTYTIQ